MKFRIICTRAMPVIPVIRLEEQMGIEKGKRPRAQSSPLIKGVRGLFKMGNGERVKGKEKTQRSEAWRRQRQRDIETEEKNF
jgi:hypothetical protein